MWNAILGMWNEPIKSCACQLLEIWKNNHRLPLVSWSIWLTYNLLKCLGSFPKWGEKKVPEEEGTGKSWSLVNFPFTKYQYLLCIVLKILNANLSPIFFEKIDYSQKFKISILLKLTNTNVDYNLVSRIFAWLDNQSREFLL